MVTVTALVRVALRWQIKADGVEKIGQGLAEGTHRNVFRSQIYMYLTELIFGATSATGGHVKFLPVG